VTRVWLKFRGSDKFGRDRGMKKEPFFFEALFRQCLRNRLASDSLDFAEILSVLPDETFIQPFIDDKRLIVRFEESFDLLVAQFSLRAFFSVNLLLKRENTVNCADKTKQKHDDDQMSFFHVCRLLRLFFAPAENFHFDTPAISFRPSVFLFRSYCVRIGVSSLLVQMSLNRSVSGLAPSVLLRWKLPR
jgi:hypothetical protein